MYTRAVSESAELPRLAHELERVLRQLETAPAFAKLTHQQRFFPLAIKLLRTPDGISVLYGAAPRFDQAGVFAGGDWDHPSRLQPKLVRPSLLDDGASFPVECLSELRMLAIACEKYEHPKLDAAGARDFLEQVLARNLDLLYPEATEATRQAASLLERPQRLFAFIAEHLGTEGILPALVDECERLTLQRPIMVHRLETMLRAAARAGRGAPSGSSRSEIRRRARELIDALEGPTKLSRRAGGPEAYAAALADLDLPTLTREARAFGRSMSHTGLACPQHATLLRFVAHAEPSLLRVALALDRIGEESLAAHADLIKSVISLAVMPGTASCIYGLSRLLRRGILFFPPARPGLQHLTVVPIADAVSERILRASGAPAGVDARALVLSGTLSVLGQPLGVDQGQNPTCQAARAISLWSQNDVGFLLDVIARAARDDDVVMHFEGEPMHSSELEAGLAEVLHTELDPVSLLLTPHLDRIYAEMSRRTLDRRGDGHRWINPELHGWWVHRGFASMISPETGAIHDLEGFARRFYASYHPEYNGGRELEYAQPCGVASTTAYGELVGWHAVSIQRVALAPQGHWRVYFYNPNRDKGQDWGHGVVTSTSGHGELEGESSLPFEQFAMRLYVFHYREEEPGDPGRVPSEHIAEIRAGVSASWAAELTIAEDEAG